MSVKRLSFLLVLLAGWLAPTLSAYANHIFIPMDNTQKESLKAYGLCYWALSKQIEVDWLLNYRGGSFACEAQPAVENELAVRGITYQTISEAQYTSILSEIADPNANMDLMKLEKVPKIAVYTPKGKQPWDDAVTMVLTYAEIPYDKIYDDEVLAGTLPKYDWLHLHHEDFTGEYGKFFSTYRYAPWYQQQQREAEGAAKRNGFKKVSEMKAAEAAGVGHVVFLSLQGAQYNFFAPHRKVEGYLIKSGMRYSLLRPSFFMQNLSTTHRDDIRLRDQLLLPAGHGRTSFVDADDVGAVAARLLAAPGASAAYELTSREALTYDEVVAQLSAVLGRPIRYRAAGIREFRAYEQAQGTPTPFINVMTGIYLAARFGLAAHVSPVLGELLGRAPGTLRAFIERERACWLP